MGGCWIRNFNVAGLLELGLDETVHRQRFSGNEIFIAVAAVHAPAGYETRKHLLDEVVMAATRQCKEKLRVSAGIGNLANDHGGCVRTPRIQR